MIYPLVLKLTTTTIEEDILQNTTIVDLFPYLGNGASLNGEFTFIFNSANEIMFDNNGIWMPLIADSIWDSDGIVQSFESIKIKNPCTFTFIMK